MNSLGGQLYARLAELLAPPESLGAVPSCLVLLEPAGKPVGAMQQLGAAERSEAVAAFVNVIPAAAPTFLDSGNFYDETWAFVLEGATPTGPPGDPVAATVARLIADNAFDLASLARASTSEPGLTYRPVQTSPADWMNDHGWAHVSFTLGGEEPPPPLPDLIVVPEEIPALTWTIENQSVAVETPIRFVDPPIEPPLEVTEPPIEVTEPPIEVIEPPIKIDEPPIEPPIEVVRPPIEVVETTVLEALPAFAQAQAFARSQALLVNDDMVTLASVEALRSDAVLADSGTTWQDVWAVSRAVDAVSKVEETAPASSGFHISFDYNVVGIRRPWLRSQICSMQGWTIPGLDLPVSDGKPINNTGLMPLITTRMLLVRDLVVQAAWSDEDRAKAEKADSLSFGPFSIAGSDSFDGSELRQPAAQIVAWLAVAVPACPKD